MAEREIEKIIQALQDMESRFGSSPNDAVSRLTSIDRANFKRLMLEAKSIFGSILGLNDFSVPLLMMTSLPSYGLLNPPSLEQLHEAIGLVQGGLNQMRRRNSMLPISGDTVQKPTYVDPHRILQLRQVKSTQLDLQRLVRLLEELNIAHANESHMSTAMLVRAVADHVPPIFNVKNFSEVANNYPAPRSFTEQMKFLDTSLRKIADMHLHQPVRKTEVLPLAPQVDFRAALDVLLAEIVRSLQ